MSPERQRNFIAEACGWKWVEGVDVPSLSHSGATACCDGWECPERGIGYGEYEPPDYPGCLNAMHEAEEQNLTTISLVVDYGLRLVNILHRDHDHHPRVKDTSWKIPITSNCGWFATAAQRAEAFLCTIGKWEDS